MSKKYFFADENGITYPEWEEKKLTDVLETVPTKSFQIFSKDVKLTGKFDVVDQGKSQIAGYSDESDKVFSNVPAIVYGDHTTIVKFRKDDFIIGADGTKVLVAKDSNVAEFLFYAVCHYNVEPEGYKRHYSILKDIFLPVPSLPEQEKITEFFSALDERIALTADKVKLLKEQKQGYLQRMMSMSKQFYFTDDNGDSYPEWEQKELREVALNNPKKYDPLKSEEEYRSVELENLTGGGAGVINGWFNSLEQKSTKNVFKSGDVLLGKLRPYLKKWARPDFEGVCSTEIWVLTSANESISNDFLYILVQSPKVQQTLIDITSGTKMPRADWKLVAQTKVALPSLPEQEKIAEFFSALDEQIELTENKLTLLKEQKKGYLQGIFG